MPNSFRPVTGKVYCITHSSTVRAWVVISLPIPSPGITDTVCCPPYRAPSNALLCKHNQTQFKSWKHPYLEQDSLYIFTFHNFKISLCSLQILLITATALINERLFIEILLLQCKKNRLQQYFCISFGVTNTAFIHSKKQLSVIN